MADLPSSAGGMYMPNVPARKKRASRLKRMAAVAKKPVMAVAKTPKATVAKVNTPKGKAVGWAAAPGQAKKTAVKSGATNSLIKPVASVAYAPKADARIVGTGLAGAKPTAPAIATQPIASSVGLKKVADKKKKMI